MSSNPLQVLIKDQSKGIWLRFSKPLHVFQARSINEVKPLLSRVEENLNKQYWAVGYINYEAAPAFDSQLQVLESKQPPYLAWFAIFDSYQVIANKSSHNVDTNIWSAAAWKSTISQKEYLTACKNIHQHIVDGNCYQINFTFHWQAKLNQELANKDWLSYILAIDPDYGAFIDFEDHSIISLSPELFFSKHDQQIVSQPMKGTIARGYSQQEDQRLRLSLLNSIKNRAENIMITDMVRNDMGKIADIGSITVPMLYEIKKYDTVWQAISEVHGKSTASLSKTLQALFPAASISGTPKVRALQIISELEKNPRGLYCGTIGLCKGQQKWQFNVAIRSLVINKILKNIEYGTGGAIVYDSKPTAEYKETKTKTKILQQAARPDFSLIETLLLEEGTISLINYHLHRLQQSASYWNFVFDQQKAKDMLLKLAKKLCLDSDLQHNSLPATPKQKKIKYKIRLLLAKNGKICLEHSPLINNKFKPFLVIASKNIDQENRFLYHKTTNRQVYEEFGNNPLAEVLLYNQHHQLTETAIANLGLEIGNKIYTPAQKCGLLPGVMRQHLLEKKIIVEAVLYKQDLAKAKNIYLFNALRKCQIVKLNLEETT